MEKIEDKLTDKEIKYMASITKREQKLKELGLAFEIFDVKNGKKINVRRIYTNGCIEGFKNNPCIINHTFPKIQLLKYLAQSINKEYRDLLRKFILADFYPMESVDKMYEENKETINRI